MDLVWKKGMPRTHNISRILEIALFSTHDFDSTATTWDNMIAIWSDGSHVWEYERLISLSLSFIWIADRKQGASSESLLWILITYVVSLHSEPLVLGKPSPCCSWGNTFHLASTSDVSGSAQSRRAAKLSCYFSQPSWQISSQLRAA